MRVKPMKVPGVLGAALMPLHQKRVCRCTATPCRADTRIGTQARFFGPRGVAADASGTAWVADQADGFDGQYIMKITPGGVVVLLQSPGTPIKPIQDTNAFATCP